MTMHPVYSYRVFMDIEFPFKLELRDEQRLNNLVHAHEHFQICYVRRGACLHHVGEQVYLMTKGDMLAIPPLIPHRFESYRTERVELVQVDFMPMVVERENLQYEPMLFPKITLTAKSQGVIEQLLINMKEEHENKEPGYQQLIKADLIRLLVTIFRESTRPVTTLQQGHGLFYEAVRYIDEHYTESLYLDKMAQLAAMSPAYFSYMFKVLMGQPFTQYVNDLRIRQAMELLRGTDRSVTEICYACGFNHVSHFAKLFKSNTGVSPLMYRKQNH